MVLRTLYVRAHCASTLLRQITCRISAECFDRLLGCVQALALKPALRPPFVSGQNAVVRFDTLMCLDHVNLKLDFDTWFGHVFFLGAAGILTLVIRSCL